jgi:hypothetical protein
MRELRSPPVLGAVIGAAAGVLLVFVITEIAGSDSQIWWWPAVALFCAIGGGVLGALIATEAEGESPDEAYDSDPARDT